MPSVPPIRRLLLAAGIGVAAIAVASLPLPERGAFAVGQAPVGACKLDPQNGKIQHVIHLQFDNLHFTRDNPNVPSDLEQMPHLLNFLRDRGALLTNHHTPLISHTATDIITTLTGVYGDRHGVPISNSFRFYNPNGTSTSVGSFAYWTDPLAAGDPTFEMLSAPGVNAPAPWVPFTRAGCNVGAVAAANIVLENIRGDITTVFGANSPEAAEATSNPGRANADFVGIAVHCAQAAALCAGANGGRPDTLPNEPGGYSGFNGLFGHKYVAPQISANGPLQDIGGNVIQDGSGHVGFPGFDGMSAAVSLGYVAAMQERGVPITYAYVSDAHDNHKAGGTFGPGEAGYVAQLRQYDDAFAAFFSRLQKDGIDERNTVFVVTADEGDHFTGGAPTPSGCDGVHTPCAYNQIGEINVNLTGLLATQQQITTPFSVHADSAPNFYLNGNPAQNAAVTREFERGVFALHGVNPLTGKDEPFTGSLADQAEMQLLHMVTADPLRTPTFTMFAKPDYFLVGGAPNCTAPCISENPAFAWNHGTTSPDITTTWLGLVGPGVARRGQTREVWSDHTDIRPTLLALTGLKDDYRSDGRVLREALRGRERAGDEGDHAERYVALARSYKQINAPLGALALASLKISTAALASNAPADAIYTRLEAQLAAFTARRDTLAGEMAALLDGAAFGNRPIAEDRAERLIEQAQTLLDDVRNAGANGESEREGD